MIVNQILRARN